MLRDVPTGSLQDEWYLHGALAFSANSRFLVLACTDAVYFWELSETPSGARKPGESFAAALEEAGRKLALEFRKVPEIREWLDGPAVEVSDPPTKDSEGGFNHSESNISWSKWHEPV